MANSYYGSIDLDELKRLLNEDKIKTFKSEKTGKETVNFTFYINAKPDQYENIANASVIFKDGKEEVNNKGEKQKYKRIGYFKESGGNNNNNNNNQNQGNRW